MKAKAGIQETYNESRSPAFSFSGLLQAAGFLNLAVGVITAAVSLLPVLLSNAVIEVECHLFILLSTVFIYNFDHSRISESDLINSPERCRWFNERKTLVASLNFSTLFVCLILLGCFLKPQVILIAFILLGTCLFYSLNSKVKTVPGLKSLIIAAVWSITCIILPAAWYGTPLTLQIWIIFGSCLTAAFINALIFDIRDFKGDKAAGIKSLPAVLGLRKTVFTVIVLSAILIIHSAGSPHLYGFAGIGICYILIATQRNAGANSLLTDLVLLLAITGLYFQA